MKSISLIILMSVLSTGCTKSKNYTLNEARLVEEDFMKWNDWPLYLKAFGDTAVHFEIASSNVKRKIIYVPLGNDSIMKIYFNRNRLIDFTQNDSINNEYKYSLISRKFYKVVRFKNKIAFIQLDENYSLDAKL